MALKARPQQEVNPSNGARHQKKLDEFLKAIESIKALEGDMKTKFRETMVKSNILKEDDWIANAYISELANSKQA